MVTQILQLLPLPIFYALGAFPTGYIIAKQQGIDIRSKGSGNVGATNIARTLGKKAGIATLFLDVVKGAIAVLLGNFISNGNETYLILAGLCCVLGHCFSFPPYLKGGKGVATAFGVLCAIKITLGLSVLISFAILFLLFRIVSIASMGAAIIASVIGLFLGIKGLAWYCLSAISLLIIYRHRENLARLAMGEEKKFSLGQSKK